MQARDRVLGVQPAPAVGEVGGVEQDLGDGHAVAGEPVLVLGHKQDLADGRGRLSLGDRAGHADPEDRASGGDRAGGDHGHREPRPVQRGDLGREPFELVGVETSFVGEDRGSDLDDHPPHAADDGWLVVRLPKAFSHRRLRYHRAGRPSQRLPPRRGASRRAHGTCVRPGRPRPCPWRRRFRGGRSRAG